MDRLKLEHHLKHLQTLHESLDAEIKKKYGSYGNDSLITEMKKKKLKLKEEIESIKQQLI
jgi:hypothetical protein